MEESSIPSEFCAISWRVEGLSGKSDEADYEEIRELKKAAYGDTFHVQVVHTDTIRIY
jgi:hypothetical protein